MNNAVFYQRPKRMARVLFEQMPLEECDRMMSVNLRGAFLCCRAPAPFMKLRRPGKIVNKSSSILYSGGNLGAQYIAAKAGVIKPTKSLTRKLGDHKINVNAIAPSLTDSVDEQPLGYA